MTDASRRVEIRSALGSFAVLQHFPMHAAPGQREACPVCGDYNRPADEEDLNVLNFERFKWGGVRHDQQYPLPFQIKPMQRRFDRLPDLLFRKRHGISLTGR